MHNTRPGANFKVPATVRVVIRSHMTNQGRSLGILSGFLAARVHTSQAHTRKSKTTASRVREDNSQDVEDRLTARKRDENNMLLACSLRADGRQPAPHVRAAMAQSLTAASVKKGRDASPGQHGRQEPALVVTTHAPHLAPTVSDWLPLTFLADAILQRRLTLCGVRI